ncbi:alpha/beta-hydrolase [Rhizodiscina lignyota]|uniref:Carboxylic ester hydrolase n=1 Tax=Rhizodiscina lignyota TaxID=1504668 RepID=A0A9P4I5M8_9PEZI|nr:alpha/beta-hydrolase [Rhizodiscina lignyota]
MRGSQFLFAFSFSQLLFAQDLIQVKTTNGTIQGGKCPSTSASQFLAIPYAQPPIGDLRFQPPQPYNGSYNGTLNATTATPSCIQFGKQFLESGPQSEDCLLLDIWVPPNTSPNSGLPVKFWVYGGSGTAGGISDPLYSGCNLATDAVVVSVNYRLGPLGFLALESAGVQGNMAIQDVIMALEWVQSNIAAFGGDPKKVVLFGQSAGAALSFMISTLPNAPSLMNAMIGESGAGRSYLPTNSSAVQEFGAQWAKNLGCSASDLSCIQSKSASAMNSSYPKSDLGLTASNNAIVTGFGYTYDGKIVPGNPAEVGAQVPVIFGHTTMEATLDILGGLNFPPSVEDYSKFLNTTFGSYASTVNKTYSLDKFKSTPFPVFYAMVEVYTDYAYSCPTYRGLLKAAENKQPAYTYIWGKEPSCPWYSAIPSDPQILQLLNATHTSEIPFVFGQVDDLPLPNGTCSFSSYEKALSADVVAAWTSMAANGNPNGKNSKINWPEFSAKSSMGLNVGNNSVTAGTVDYTRCQFWDAIDQGITNSTSNTSIFGSSSSSSGSSSTTSSAPAATSSSGSSGMYVVSGLAWSGMAAAFLLGV